MKVTQVTFLLASFIFMTINGVPVNTTPSGDNPLSPQSDQISLNYDLVHALMLEKSQNLADSKLLTAREHKQIQKEVTDELNRRIQIIRFQNNFSPLEQAIIFNEYLDSVKGATDEDGKCGWKPQILIAFESLYRSNLTYNSQDCPVFLTNNLESRLFSRSQRINFAVHGFPRIISSSDGVIIPQMLDAFVKILSIKKL
ncbi:unnamed protein product [Thelazia callipaeda]|uniref:Astacin domain-containing protein n=1 Tax=Thelazia callipaeda TaxID=103827 RepID=A0A0N5CSP0_THECL|nr:unnamed protein product [Thelazia callipaeda]